VRGAARDDDDPVGGGELRHVRSHPTQQDVAVIDPDAAPHPVLQHLECRARSTYNGVYILYIIYNEYTYINPQQDVAVIDADAAPHPVLQHLEYRERSIDAI